MKILVPIKRVVDYAVKVRVNSDRISGVDISNVKMSINPFCEIAVEEAIRLKENKRTDISEIVAVCIGPKQCLDTLRNALAMGCDRGIHINTDDKRTDFIGFQSDVIAKILQKVVDKETPDLILLGKQSIDSDSGVTGPYLSGLLDLPLVTSAASIGIKDNSKNLMVEKETDNGTELLKILSLPAVITCDLRLNQPRYATLPNIMKAKKKRVDVLSVDDMGVDLKTKNKVVEVYAPKTRKQGKIVKDVNELVSMIKKIPGIL